LAGSWASAVVQSSDRRSVSGRNSVADHSSEADHNPGHSSVGQSFGVRRNSVDPGVWKTRALGTHVVGARPSTHGLSRLPSRGVWSKETDVPHADHRRRCSTAGRLDQQIDRSLLVSPAMSVVTRRENGSPGDLQSKLVTCYGPCWRLSAVSTDPVWPPV